MPELLFQAQPRIQSLIYFSHGAAFTFYQHKFWGLTNSSQFVRDGRTKLHQVFGGHLSSSVLPKFVLDGRYIASFQNWSASKSKIRPNFDIFELPVKNYGGVTEESGLERRLIIITQGGSIRVPISSFVLKPQSVKGDWCRNRGQISHFLPPCKKYGRGM